MINSCLDGQGKHQTAGGCLRQPGRGLIIKIPKPETVQPVGFTARGNYRKDVALRNNTKATAEFDAKVALNKRDFEARFDKARWHMARRQWTAALDELLDILMRSCG